jgi:DNA invertase Pin-like site-specific DNA recombinase
VNPLPSPDPRLAVVLRRVSSAEQADAYGLDAQLRDCKRFAAAEGLQIVADFSEDARSTTQLDERPGGRAALDAMVQHGAGVLLLAARDRLARDPYVAGHAERVVALAGGRILYAEGGNGESDSDRLLGDIRHAISAHERRVIVARLRKGREEKQAKHPTSQAQGGSVAYGYVRMPTEVVVDDEAAEVVRQAFRIVRDGASLRKITAALAEASGRKWSAQGAADLIRREVYKQQQPGRIVDPRVWNAANATLAARSKPAVR